MTREEAIVHMILRREELNHSVGDLDKDIEAFDMAIKALEQEPKTDTWSIKDVAGTLAKHGLIVEQEPCEDAVSRQSVKELFREACEMEMYAFLGIDDLPPVIPQPKTGHWILLDECSNSGYYCLECQKKVVKEGWSDTVKKIKFCPNCGAKME